MAKGACLMGGLDHDGGLVLCGRVLQSAQGPHGLVKPNVACSHGSLTGALACS